MKVLPRMEMYRILAGNYAKGHADFITPLYSVLVTKDGEIVEDANQDKRLQREMRQDFGFKDFEKGLDMPNDWKTIAKATTKHSDWNESVNSAIRFESANALATMGGLSALFGNLERTLDARLQQTSISNRGGTIEESTSLGPIKHLGIVVKRLKPVVSSLKTRPNTTESWAQDIFDISGIATDGLLN